MNTNLYIAKTLWRKGAGRERLVRVSAIIAIISVAISIFVVLLSVAISDGFRKEINDKASGLSGQILIHSPGTDVTTSQYPIDNDPVLIDKILSIRGVKSVHPYGYRSAVLESDSEIHGVLIKGVDSLFDWSFFQKYLVSGRMPNVSNEANSNQHELLISQRLSNIIDHSIGDDVVAYFVDDVIRVRKFKIVGIYDAQLEDIDKTLVLTSLKTVQGVNNWSKEKISGLEVMLHNSRKIERLAERVEYELYNYSRQSLFATRVDELFPNLFDWLVLIDFNVLFVLILMLSVAGFNMVSGLLILLFEKTSMIGLLKSLGMKNSSIHKVFMIRALDLVFRGVIIGNVLAISIILLQYYFQIIPLDAENYFVDHVPVNFNIAKWVVINVLSIISISLLLILPSYFIANVSPEKTLRVK